MTGRTVGAAVIAAVLGLAAASTVALSAEPRSEIHSPLRAGAKPGCRWVLGEPKTTRICDSRTGACRLQTTPAQRIWACGKVRD